MVEDIEKQLKKLQVQLDNVTKQRDTAANKISSFRDLVNLAQLVINTVEERNSARGSPVIELRNKYNELRDRFRLDYIKVMGV